MPTTRSATRSAANAATAAPANSGEAVEIGNTTKTKRRNTGSTSGSRKKARAISAAEVPGGPEQEIEKASTPHPSAPQAALAADVVVSEDNSRHLVPAKLSFSFEEAKEHLIKVDPRFEDIFSRLPCKPYEHLEQFDPFNILASSILGQQISWKAARSITHRFVKLFNASLPESPDDYKLSDHFPTAHQVVKMDQTTLRTAGLSGRKAEYVLDLAARFADGRLTTEKLLEADDEELYEILTAVRGIGNWTVDMFAIFSLRRPDILPVGDLGVQRGVARWFLSLHSPSYNLMISPEKLPKSSGDEESSNSANTVALAPDKDTLPVLGGTVAVQSAGTSSVVPAATKSKGKGKAKGKKSADDNTQDSVLPTPFTPSINRILNARVSSSGEPFEPPPLPVGMTVAMLRARLDTKKKLKGVFLSPKEMEHLTASWRPYRSLGVYYMWALAEDTSP